MMLERSDSHTFPCIKNKTVVIAPTMNANSARRAEIAPVFNDCAMAPSPTETLAAPRAGYFLPPILDSSPLNSRRIFSWWRAKASNAISTAITVRGVSASQNMKKGEAASDTKAASDE